MFVPPPSLQVLKSGKNALISFKLLNIKHLKTFVYFFTNLTELDLDKLMSDLTFVFFEIFEKFFSRILAKKMCGTF